MKNAAIYARVSSAQQKQEHTIASQTAALIKYAEENGYHVPREWILEDEGFSGANLQRPGLERVRDLAAEGQLEAVLVYSPDRLSRKYAYQVLLMEELARQGVRSKIRVDKHGRTTGSRPLAYLASDVPSGAVTLLLRRTGYADHEETLNVEPLETVTLQTEMTPQ